MTTTRNIIYKMLTQHLLPTMYVQQTNASIVDELRNIIHEHNAVMSNTAANGNIVQFLVDKFFEIESNGLYHCS